MKRRFTLTGVGALLALTTILAFAPLTAQTVVLSEGFEDGTLGAFTSYGVPGWYLTSVVSHTGTYSAHAPDRAEQTDLQLTTTEGIEIPAGADAELRFWHWFRFDLNYDGGVLEFSDDGGTSWTDAEPLFVSGGYNGQISGSEENPLGVRRAWVYSTNGEWREVVVDLSSFAGETILFRLREGTGRYFGNDGWLVDDITVTISEVPPTISVTLDPTILWSPNHRMQTINATLDITALDGATVQLVSVFSNEPDNGEDDGNTVDDIQNAATGTDDRSFDVRKERSGVGTGRIYTATYRVTNPSGIWAEASATVTVPLSSGID